MQAVIGTPTGDTFQIELDETQESALVGKRIGDEVEGSVLGLSGYTLEVRGGSDTDGFPMKQSVTGTGRKRILLTKEAGGKDLEKGERIRKSVRGNTVSEAIEQLNLAVVEAGSEDVETLLFGESEDEGSEESEAESDTAEEQDADEAEDDTPEDAEADEPDDEDEAEAEEAEEEPEDEDDEEKAGEEEA